MPTPALEAMPLLRGSGSSHNFAAEAITPLPPQQQPLLPPWAVASRRPFPVYFAPLLRDNVQQRVPLYAHRLHASYEGMMVPNEVPSPP